MILAIYRKSINRKHTYKFIFIFYAQQNRKQNLKMFSEFSLIKVA